MVVANIDPLMAVDIPHGWDLIPLGKCVSEKLSYGVNAPAIPYNGCYPCYIRITDITEDGQYDDSDKKSVAITFEEKERYSLKVGDIVLARTGASTGKSYLYNEEDGELVYAGFLIKAAVNVRSHNPRFIVAQLRTKRYWTWVAATSMRSGQPGINGKEYAAFLIPVAPKKEQDKIAETLSQLDIYIDDLAELIEKKRGIRNGALEDLMSQRTRLDGFNDEWIERSFYDFMKIKRGASPRPIENYLTASTDGVNWIKIGDAPRYGKYITSTAEKITQQGAVQSVRVYPGDFVLSNSMSFGRPYILNVDGCIHDGWLRLYDFQEEANAEFMYYLLSSSYVQKQYEAFAAGSGVQNLNKEIVKKVIVYLPSLPEQDVIAAVMTAMDEEIEALETEWDKMIQIREGVMDDLLTGRVRLSV